MRVGLSTLRRGMVVDEDVTDSAGRVLVTAGTRLDDRQLKQLKAWGVGQVEIGDDPASMEAATVTVSAAQKERVRARFDNADLNHPLISHLFTRALEIESERSGEERS